MKDTCLLNPKKIERFIFYLLVLLLPTQLAYHFWPEYAFIFGIRIDYLAPAVYLTDLLVIFLIAVSRTKIKTIYLLTFFLFSLINIYFSISPWVGFWKWLKILEFVFFAKYVYDNKSLVKTKVFAKIFSVSLIAVSIIGISQFLLGRTFGWPLTLLGERTFSISMPGIALENIFGRDYLRAYSIFSHPNSFAGYLFVSILFLLSIPVFKKIKLFWFTILLSAVSFLLTFSFSAFVATGIGIPVALIKFNPDSLEVRERLELVNTSKEIITKNFLTGTGLNTFVYASKNMQPVHNIFLLVLSETGIVGLGIVLLLFYKLFKNAPLIAWVILVTGFFDHYWLTLQQNMLLLAFVFATLESKHG